MITNERQQQRTLEEIERFQAAISQVDADHPDASEQARQAMRGSMEVQIRSLQQQLQDFADLKAGLIKRFSVSYLEDIGEALTKARVAADLSQRQLARRLKLKEQQIQRYEASRYRSASLHRLAQIADALDTSFFGEVRMADAEEVAPPSALTSERRIEVADPPGQFVITSHGLAKALTFGDRWAEIAQGLRSHFADIRLPEPVTLSELKWTFAAPPELKAAIDLPTAPAINLPALIPASGLTFGQPPETHTPPAEANANEYTLAA